MYCRVLYALSTVWIQSIAAIWLHQQRQVLLLLVEWCGWVQRADHGQHSWLRSCLDVVVHHHGSSGFYVVLCMSVVKIVQLVGIFLCMLLLYNWSTTRSFAYGMVWILTNWKLNPTQTRCLLHDVQQKQKAASWSSLSILVITFEV